MKCHVECEAFGDQVQHDRTLVALKRNFPSSIFESRLNSGRTGWSASIYCVETGCSGQLHELVVAAVETFSNGYKQGLTDR